MPPRDSVLTDAAFDELVQLGDDAWSRFAKRVGGAFQYLIPADYRGARACLAGLRPHAESFLELGSGVGVITILADLLGYDAYGIEIEPQLVRDAAELADRFGSGATFVEGSFVPTAYRDEVEHLSGDFLTITDGADAYEELGMAMSDFDVVYAYPWPGEEDWLAELVRRYGGEATLICYSVHDGFVVTGGG